jgi:hypothetical protein
MTTPTDFLAWKARAEKLAEDLADATWGLARAYSPLDEERQSAKVQTARAALSAHLLAVPIGEPVAWRARHLPDSPGASPGEWGHTGNRAMAEHHAHAASLFEVQPLFTKPEGMA